MMALMKRVTQHVRRGPDLRKILSQHLADGTLDAGVDYFRSIVLENPLHGPAWLMLGRLRETQGELEKAYVAYHESAVAAQQSRYLSLEAKVQRLLDVVKFCLKHGWHERAKSNINAALVLDRSNVVALRMKDQLERASEPSVVAVVPKTAALDKQKQLRVEPTAPEVIQEDLEEGGRNHGRERSSL